MRKEYKKNYASQLSDRACTAKKRDTKLNGHRSIRLQGNVNFSFKKDLRGHRC